ncbi:putative uncharacterized protein domain protein [Halorubrum sp. AJ67]|nr:putative uncharacterized protein domain protein [Halorubrum sp. AJ67]
MLLELLESPLDEVIERLRVDFDSSQLNQLSKHPAERWLSRSHIARLASAQCNYTVFPRFYIRGIFAFSPVGDGLFVDVDDVAAESQLKESLYNSIVCP